MLHKRKRSESTFSSSSSSTFSSPPRPEHGDSTFSFAFSAGALSSPYPNPFACASPSSRGVSSHLHSRTMKRFRNGRPSEEEVHQRTVGMLFAAQQQQLPQHRSLFSPGAQIDSIMTMGGDEEAQGHSHRADGGQSSLHRFWKINSAPSSATSQIATQAQTYACEDCGAGLGNGDGMDTDEAEECACGACGKKVCFSCSVSNLGAERRCLVCAGKGSLPWLSR